MNKECQIKDDDEILEEEKQRYNFRRFTQEEIIKKNNPFERFKKKEPTFPFLFQKKKVINQNVREDMRISLDDIINQVKDLSFNSIFYSPKTPSYFPIPIYDISGNYTDSSIIPSFTPNPVYDLDGNIINIPTLNLEPIMDIDEQK